MQIKGILKLKIDAQKMSFLSHLCAHYAMQLSWPVASFFFHCPVTLVLNPDGSRNGCEPTNRYRLRFMFTTHVSKYVALRYIKQYFFATLQFRFLCSREVVSSLRQSGVALDDFLLVPPELGNSSVLLNLHIHRAPHHGHDP